MKSKSNTALWILVAVVATVVSIDQTYAGPVSQSEADYISLESARDQQRTWERGREARLANGVYHASDSAWRAERAASTRADALAEGNRLARTGTLAEIAKFKAKHETSLGETLAQNGRWNKSNTFKNLEAREKLLRAAKRGAGGSALRAIVVGAGVVGALAAKPTDANAATVDADTKAFESVRFNGTAPVASETPSFAPTAAARTAK